MDDLDLFGIVGVLFEKSDDEIEEMHKHCWIVEDLLCERFNVDVETFREIATALLNLCPVIETAVTGTKYHAFVDGDVILARAKAET